MSNQNGTEVKTGETMPWTPIPEHPELYHREILTAKDADGLGVSASSVLWERIGVGGGVLPHYHNVAEVIHITVGKVKLLCNGEWKPFRAGDTFVVPAGTVHSVMNDDTAPTEQISIFLPVQEEPQANRFFDTFLVEGYGITAASSEKAYE